MPDVLFNSPWQRSEIFLSMCYFTAATVWGALRGLETFAQLVFWDFNAHVNAIRAVPISITDQPRFPHRAFMIDTARHWEPLPVFARLLDGMVMCKLNTLHWHISDGESCV